MKGLQTRFTFLVQVEGNYRYLIRFSKLIFGNLSLVQEGLLPVQSDTE
jgi:hypothetical protein